MLEVPTSEFLVLRVGVLVSHPLPLVERDAISRINCLLGVETRRVVPILDGVETLLASGLEVCMCCSGCLCKALTAREFSIPDPELCDCRSGMIAKTILSVELLIGVLGTVEPSAGVFGLV